MRRESLLAAILLLVLFGQAVTSSVRMSLTTDEPMHTAMGYTDWLGDYSLLPAHIHPPLANMWSAWPLLLRPDRPELRQVPGWAEGNLWKFSAQLLLRLGPVEAIELATRVPIMLLALLLGALVYRWACDLFGARAGLLALLLYVFDPGIVSNSQFNTTDIGALVFGLLATFVAWRATRRPTTLRIVLIGLALGMSMAAKVSGLFFVPLLAALVGVTLLRTHWSKWNVLGKQVLRWGMRFLLIYVLAFVIVWATYRFEFKPLPGTSFPVPAASHWLVLQAFNRHVAEGHLAFLAGQVGQHGWWWYFPLAFAVKTPIPTLLLLMISVANRLRQRRRLWIDDIWLLAIPVVYFLNAMFSTIDIGYRHLLPIFPFLFIFIGGQISNFKPQTLTPAPLSFASAGVSSLRSQAKPLKFEMRYLILAILGLWYVVGAARIFPHYLAYFNELAGGPDGGYRYLVDSNTDWGQTLKELKRYMETRGISTVNLSQFTFIDPAIYGLSYQPIAPMMGAPPVLSARFNPPPGVYAISTTTLQGIPLADPEQFDWFRQRTPEAKIGHVMFLYRVEETRPRAWVAQCTTPVTPLRPQEIAEGLGRSDLRLAYFDCATSWLQPGGGQSPGWVVLSRDAPMWNVDWLKTMRLSYEQKRTGFTPPFRIYEDDGGAAYTQGGRVRIAPSALGPTEALAAPPIELPVTFDGGLTLLGYALDRSALKPGETAHLETIWRVDSVPGRLLSIMAHTLGPDGRTLAVGDGLGVPIESWQIGDVIVQRHALAVPEAAPRGTYWLQTGVYWIDDGKRWQAQDARASGDRVLLTALKIQ